MDGVCLREQVLEYAKELGFVMVRVTTAEPLAQWQTIIDDRKAQEQGFIKSWGHRTITSDPTKIMADAASILVGLFPYLPYKEVVSEGYGVHSSYYNASHTGYQKIKQLASFFNCWGYQAIPNPILPAKAIAFRAGIGTFGKNGLLYTEEYGSFFSIDFLVTNAVLETDPPLGKISDCGSCRLCVDTCPVAAIGENGAIRLDRCLRNYMFSSEIIPEALRGYMGNRILGCDICQNCCPKNQRIVQQDDQTLLPLSVLLQGDGATFKKIVTDIGNQWGNNYARGQRLIAQAIIVAGNSRETSYIPYLSHTLRHAHPPIRAHSAWALGEIRAAECKSCLQVALLHEQHPDVLQEIQRALEKCEGTSIFSDSE